MRCEACDFESPEGFRFCGGCGAPLAGDAARDAPRPGPGAYTPRHLVDEVLRTRAALEGERKEVTVLFIDVKGSMGLAEALGAEAWHRALDRLFRILSDGVHRFEGTVNQYTGDGLMALFGAPLAHEDHARRAAHAALQIARSVDSFADDFRRRHGRELRIRMGLNSGAVVVGRIGDDLRMDYTAQGHVVGLAARVQQLAEPGGIWLTGDVEHRLRGWFHTTPLGERVLEGAREPVALFALEGEAPAGARRRGGAFGDGVALVGRSGNWATLCKALSDAREGNGLVLDVQGDAGVGKSRLCRDFAAHARGAGVAVVEAQCPSHASGMPHFALRELVRSLLDLEGGEPEATTRARVAEVVGAGAGSRRLLALLGLEAADRGDLEALHGEVAALLVGRAEVAPLLVWVDDVHWVDETSAAFLGELAGRVAGRRMLLLANFRSGYAPPFREDAAYRELGLAALDRREAKQLIERIVGRDPSTAALRERVREETQGNPLFVEELVRSLVESGSLEGSPGAFRLCGGDARLEVPGSIQAVISARIDRLAERDKWVLQLASVLGKRFEESVLARVGGLPESELREALAALQDAELVHRANLYSGSYVFRHPLTREVAYGSLLSATRVELHGGVAAALEQSGDRLGERADLIAHHWERGGRGRDAAAWRRRAAFHVTHIVPRRGGRERRPQG